MDDKSSQQEQLFSYIAVLIYECTIDAPDTLPLYEECFLLLKASS